MPGIEHQLRKAGVRKVRVDRATRAAFSSDASLYRVVPRAVVSVEGVEDIAAVIDVARDSGCPVTARGAGTSVAGNAIGPGIIVDFSRHFDRVLDIDLSTRTAKVQPGALLAAVQRAAAPHGLRFGPDPSTHNRCTIGGMIGNNACGARAIAYGPTSDNVVELKLLTGTGDHLAVRSGPTPSHSGFEHGVRDLRLLTQRNLAVLRTEFGRFPRQISGYGLQHLLPEKGFDVARTLVGTEGTLGLFTEATLALVESPTERLLVVLGFADISRTAEAAYSLRDFEPTACEGIDSRIVDVVRQRRGDGAVPTLPRGAAWLFVELSGNDRSEIAHRALQMVKAIDGVDGRIVSDDQEATALWRIREDGAGLSGRAPSGMPAWAGWEDAAVPPAALGDYLREFDALVLAHGLTHMPFGHFGDGCVHTRLDFPLANLSGRGRMRSFMEAAAELVAKHGGSFSGEHGDGRARSELLPRMYSASALALFADVKRVFDPQDILNPGVIVSPSPLDESLRMPASAHNEVDLVLGYQDDGASFGRAVHRCTGVGRCRTSGTDKHVVMCPSFAATREEKDSTRGRARVLQEMVDGTFVKGWRDEAVHDALDLCLSCKGCLSDCPTGVDMATYKSEVLHHSFKGRLRPVSHYSLGRLPTWSRLAGALPRTANWVMGIGPLRRQALRLAGIDSRRAVPPLATQSFRKWFGARDQPRPKGEQPVVTLFVDTFTNVFTPRVGRAAVSVLESAGYEIAMSKAGTCCGLTLISTGQLTAARRRLEATVEHLDTRSAGPIVGLEPSCTAVLRHDSLQLLGTPASRRVAARVRTLAEALEGTDGWSGPDLSNHSVVAQPHCHHHAVMGWEADERLLIRLGASVGRLGGCCGLAGNFGMEKGHYEVSVSVAEQYLLPSLRTAEPGTVFLADGFSCRKQAEDLANVAGVHLAELLSGQLMADSAPVHAGSEMRNRRSLRGGKPSTAESPLHSFRDRPTSSSG